MTSAENRTVIRTLHPDAVRAEPAPEAGGAALVLADGVEVLLAGPNAAAYLTRLATAIATARGLLRPGRPHRPAPSPTAPEPNPVAGPPAL
ncbi:hypothetical protein J0910_03620 [Nocardiopsis sp. CNT-189]|uniref:hypothetical protein n=1 Tax=Nocardiopsis oceanisediminis TaxID=2816862 RepID=UPI003B3910BE